MKDPVPVAAFIPVHHVDDAMVAEKYRARVEEHPHNTAALKALELERSGGPCFYCDTPFREVAVKNRFGDFKFFEPACQCYKRCDHVVDEACVDKDGNQVAEERCGRWMVEERFRGLARCLLCYGEPVKRKEVEKKKRAKRFKDGKAVAAGEREEQG